MRNRAKHSWLAAVLVANCSNQAIGQGDLGVSVLGTTATQAMLTYTAPTDAPCIVEASDSPEYWQPLHDLDLLTIEGANSDDRGGRQRTILIGTPSTEVGRGNTAQSRSLQPDTLYYFRFTCGQAVATGTFRTAPPTNGITYSDAPLPSQPSPSTPAIADSISHRPPPVPSPRRPPWRPRRPSGRSCVSNGTGGGAWNSPATWTGCAGGVPGYGDMAALSNGDTVTIPSGYQAVVGISDAGGPEGTAAVKCTSEEGTGKLAISGTLTFRGNIEQCTAVWRVGQDAIIEHDSSLAPSPSTTHYRWIIGMIMWPDAAQLVIRGTVGHRVTIRNAPNSGTFYGFTYNRHSNQGSGQVDLEYATIDGCGGASPCVDSTSHNAATASIARCDHCLVTNSGYFGASTMGGAANVVRIANSTFTSAADPSKYVVRLTPGGQASIVLDTVFTTGAIALLGGAGGSATGTHIRNVIVNTLSNDYPITLEGSHFRVAEFDLVLRIADRIGGGGNTGTPAYLPGGALTRIMCLMNSNSNPHCFSGPAGDAISGDSIDGGYAEKIGTGTDGDLFLGGPLGTTITTFRNFVSACSTVDGQSIGTFNNLTGSTSGSVVMTQNTICGKDPGNNQGVGFSFEIWDPVAGVLRSATDNLVFCATNTACYLVRPGPIGTPANGAYNGVDYNWRWNVSTGPYYGASAHYTSPSPPGAHDSSGDPRFVQQRHFLDWGQMLDPTISTWTDIVSRLSKMNDEVGYDSRFSLVNAYTWLRDGYRPQTGALMTAGEAGARVGAMDSVSQR